MTRRGRLVGVGIVIALTLASVAVAGAGASTSGARLWISHGPHVPLSKVAIAVSPDGARVFETGEVAVTGGEAYGTVARDTATGRTLWVARYQSHKYALDRAWAIAVSPDGETVFVTGESTDTPNVMDYATAAYDTATGEQRWVARFDDPNHGEDTAQSVAVSPDDGLVFVTGYADSFSGHPFAATVAYDATTGVQRWATMLPSKSGARAVAVSPDGSAVFVSGSRADSAVSIAYDARTGTELWNSTYHTTLGYDGAQGERVSPDGATLLVIDASTVNGNADYVTIAYDAATGHRRWVARDDNAAHADDQVEALAVSPDGSHVFVTGSSTTPGVGIRYMTIAYDMVDGHQTWRSSYTTSQHVAEAWSVAVSPDSTRVVVTGQGAHIQYDNDYVTIAYDAATGAQVWRARGAKPKHYGAFGRAVAIDPAGARVFVTGIGPMVAYAL